MTDPSTDQPLTRRQRRELEAADRSNTHAAPVMTDLFYQRVTVVDPAIPAPARPEPGARAARTTILVPTAPTAPTVPTTPTAPTAPPSQLESFQKFLEVDPEPVALPPFVASAYPKRGNKPVAGKKPRKRGTASRSPRAARGYSKLFSMVAMLFAGALLVGISVPANAIKAATVDPAAVANTAIVPGQSLAVSSDVVAAAASPKRETPTVTSYAELLRQKSGNRSYTYTATTGAIRWPFPYAVPITDGYGERVAPCRGCSTFHQGVDFTPGDGTPITAIANGTVVFTEVTSSGIGNQVQIEHTVGGKKITSVYAGMRMNSSPLRVGDAIKVGDFVGLVGSTGVATGPHLHFELLVGTAKVDPFAWLKTNATNAN